MEESKITQDLAIASLKEELEDVKLDVTHITKERDQALEQVRRYESELIRIRGLADELALALARSTNKRLDS